MVTKTPSAWCEQWLKVTVTHDEVQKAAFAVRDWCIDAAKNVQGKPHLLVLAGNTGCGKTHMADNAMRFMRCAAHHANSLAGWGKPMSSWRYDWPDVATGEVGEVYLREMADHGVVMLDDIGAEVDRYKSGLPIERLRIALSRREHKWTIITTNVMPEKWAEQWDARVADRLLRDSTVVMLRSAPSFAVWSRTQNKS